MTTIYLEQLASILRKQTITDEMIEQMRELATVENRKQLYLTGNNHNKMVDSYRKIILGINPKIRDLYVEFNYEPCESENGDVLDVRLQVCIYCYNGEENNCEGNRNFWIE